MQKTSQNSNETYTNILGATAGKNNSYEKSGETAQFVPAKMYT